MKLVGLDLRWDRRLRDLQIQLEPRVGRSDAASSKRLVRMVPGSARNWIAVNAVQHSFLNKNENKTYDNSTVKTLNRPVASAARFASHPARARLLCAFAPESFRGSASTGWRLRQ